MQPKHRTSAIFAITFAAGLLLALLVPFATRSMSAAAAVYYVSPSGSDSNNGSSASTPFKTIQKAVDLAQPGAQISLADGVYLQDIHSTRDGAASAPITISGSANAIVKGGGGARIIEINHDNITLDGFTLDGLWGDPNSLSGYRDKLLYVLGKQARDGVSGLHVLHMTLRNAGGECVRLRYFAQGNEIAYSSISTCGVHDFRFKAGGKNGEGIYIGTAPEQRGDGKNPTSDPDLSINNWVHNNTFNTQGNECVDLKEATTANIVENNSCTGQTDPESGGFDSRGNGNVFRNNEIFGNLGTGIRLGGDTAADGIGNDIYNNAIHDNKVGGIRSQRQPQGQVCGNTMANNTSGNAIGDYGKMLSPTTPCAGQPAPTAQPTAVPTSAPAQPTAQPTAVPTSAPAQPTATPVAPQPQGCTRFYAVDGNATSVIEAEAASSSNGRFVQAADVARSGGIFMTIPNANMRKDPATYLSFDLNVSNGGTFYVWMLGYGPNSNADSFLFQVDSAKTSDAVMSRDGWGWKRVGGSVTLADGAHTLKIANREDGASVDSLLLTRDKRFKPSGFGAPTLAPQCGG